MSRRRSAARAYDIRVRVVCTDRGSHDPYRLGTIEWYSEGAAPGRVQIRTNGDGRVYRHRSVDRVEAVKNGMPQTVTFTCPVCSLNLSIKRSKWQPWLLELEALGVDELDVSGG